MHEGESGLDAFDRITRELRWKTTRNHETPREFDHGHTMPLTLRLEDPESPTIAADARCVLPGGNSLLRGGRTRGQLKAAPTHLLTQ